MNRCAVKDYGHTWKFYFIIFFDRAFECGGGSDFEVMLWHTLNHSLEFCNFRQCYTFLNYLTYYYYCNKSQVLFHDGPLLHSKFNTQLLITIKNSS
jgi:hypothetical protein